MERADRSAFNRVCWQWCLLAAAAQTGIFVVARPTRLNQTAAHRSRWPALQPRAVALAPSNGVTARVETIARAGLTLTGAVSPIGGGRDSAIPILSDYDVANVDTASDGISAIGPRCGCRCQCRDVAFLPGKHRLQIMDAVHGSRSVHTISDFHPLCWVSGTGT
jgi:hypothetical protein